MSKKVEYKLPADDWRRQLHEGDEVWWNDPDRGISSGVYKVVGSNGRIKTMDSIVLLRNAAGSESEVFAGELASIKPEDLHVVVDAEDRCTYGYAASEEEAVDVGSSTFGEEGVDFVAVLEDNFTLVDGSVAEKAWVVKVRQEELAKLRLVVDVDYLPNGVSIDWLKANLQAAFERAVGEGMLTGSSEAEVESWSSHVVAPSAQPAEGKEIVVHVDPSFEPDDGDVFGAVLAALDFAEIPSSVVERDIVKPRIVIDLEGGLVNEVTSSVPLDYLVFDHDVEGCDESDVVERLATTGEGRVEVYDAGFYAAAVNRTSVEQIFTDLANED